MLPIFSSETISVCRRRLFWPRAIHLRPKPRSTRRWKSIEQPAAPNIVNYRDGPDGAGHDLQPDRANSGSRKFVARSGANSRGKCAGDTFLASHCQRRAWRIPDNAKSALPKPNRFCSPVTKAWRIRRPRTVREQDSHFNGSPPSTKTGERWTPPANIKANFRIIESRFGRITMMRRWPDRVKTTRGMKYSPSFCSASARCSFSR